MRLGTCSREKEVAESLGRGHWPDASSADLRAHVADCRSCGELVLVARAMRAERAQAASHARLQPSGALWWRAQLRRRNEALRRIDRPMFGAQIFAVALSLVSTVLFLFAELKRGVGWVSWFQELPRSLHLESLLPSASQNAQGSGWLVVPLLAMLALASGVIVYMASDKQ